MRALLLVLGVSVVLCLGIFLGIVALNALESDPDDTGPEAVVLRLDAPDGKCWSATIAGRPLREDCGSAEIPLGVIGGFVSVHIELQRGNGAFTAMIEADGRIVQTVGPTRDEYPSLDIAYGTRPSP